jgi:hypothetical protein
MYNNTTRRSCCSTSSQQRQRRRQLQLHCDSNSQLLLIKITTLITCLAIVIQHLSIQGNEEPFPSLLYYGTLLHDLFFCPTSTNTSTTASARYHVLRILSTFLLLHRTLLALSFFGVPHLPTPVQYNNNNGKSKTPLP